MVKNVFLLTMGDRLGQYNPIQPPHLEDVESLIALVDEIMADEGRFTMKQLAINGTIIMKELQIPASPLLGKLLHQAYERVLEDLDRNDPKTLIDMVRQWMTQ
jgi:tRNA nucleotidyltransferase (CCA-adding enzyme)